MTEEQIDRIAREYAEENYNVRGGVELMAGEARNVIEFILRDHLIVEKGKVMDEYDTAVSTQHSDNCDTARYSQTIRYHLEDLFGEETFNQEEQ